MTVTVTNGQATCQGSSVRDEKEYEGSRLDRSKRATGVVSGPGIIVVEFKRQNVPRITVACPSATVTETTTDYLSNQTGTGTSNAKPVNWRDRISIDPAPASAIGVDLVGNKAVPHPEEDPLNGVTGRMTLTWSLRRN